MNPEPPQEKSLDEVLKELGVEEEEDKTELRLPDKVEDKTELRLPAKMELIRRDSEIEIVRKWFGWEIVLLTAFAVFWGWSLFTMSPNLGAIRLSEESLYFLLFLAALIGLTYYALAGWLNRTHIVVSRGKITVRHRPIPWVGNKELETSNLKQLYTEEHVHHHPKSGGTYFTYDVHAITSDDRRFTFVAGLKTREQASFIEHEIEKYLGIKDMPVEGEIGPAFGEGKDVAIDAGVATAYRPRLERARSDREIREALLAPAWVQQEKRQELRDKQGLIDLALNWQERGRPDSLQHADLIQADLRGAKLGKDEEGHPGANLSFANLLNANLGGADLREVDLYNANLSGAALEGANLEGANLYEVNFSGANLEGATLVGAKVVPEQLAQAKSLKGAIMPDGTVHP
jgi:hypothetical protein